MNAFSVFHFPHNNKKWQWTTVAISHNACVFRFPDGEVGNKSQFGVDDARSMRVPWRHWVV